MDSSNHPQDLDWSMLGSLEDSTSERYDKDMEWVSSNRAKLVEYEGKWVAVYNKKVIAADKNPKLAKIYALNMLGKDILDPPFMRFIEKGLVIQTFCKKRNTKKARPPEKKVELFVISS